MSKKPEPLTTEEMVAELSKVSLYEAQYKVNSWARIYGNDAVTGAQAEVDRRRRKLIANDDGAAAAEASYYAELERGYRRDRA
jgi:hypothetical protein